MDYFKIAEENKWSFLPEEEWTAGKEYAVCHKTDGCYFAKYFGKLDGNHLWGAGSKQLALLSNFMFKEKPAAYNTNKMKPFVIDIESLPQANWKIGDNGMITIENSIGLSPVTKKVKTPPKKILNESA